MPYSEQVQEQIKLFAEIAAIYKAGMTLGKDALDDPVQALSEFVGGYAFEHQGRSPSYGPVASDTVKQFVRRLSFWQDQDSPKEVWTMFEKTLQEQTGSRLNPKNNPLCYKGYDYEDQRGHVTVKKLSAIEFIQKKLKGSEYNIVLWVKRLLDQDQVQEAHHELHSINGIGPKVASLFLRDVAWSLETYPDNDRVLLQPLDIWVKRVVHTLGQTPEGKESAWIVDTALKVGVLPEAINAAMWYFGANVASSEYKLSLAMNSVDTAWQMVDEHVKRVTRQMRAWTEAHDTKP